MTEIFVDATGRRRRRVRRIAYAVGATCLLYTALVGTSVIGAGNGPRALGPFPALGDRLPGGTPAWRPPAPLRAPVSATPRLETRRSLVRSNGSTRLAAPQRDTERSTAPARRSSTRPAAPILESTPDPVQTPPHPPEPEPTPTEPTSTEPTSTDSPTQSPEPTPPVIELPRSPDPSQTPTIQ